jgi:RTX calcium-binding nonapeptide repeat (4 copies)
LNSLPLSVRPCLLALAALALIAAPAHAAKARHGVTATVAHRTLTVAGDRHANKIALRVKRRARGTLQVDAGDNRSADFSFNRKLFNRIVLRGGSGNDVLRLDEAGRAFVAAERVSTDGQRGSDRLSLTGSPGTDNVGVSAAGARVRVGPAAAAGIERVDLSTGAGADRLSVGDLAGTPVRQLSLDSGDGADRLAVAGSGAPDSFGLARNGPFVHLQHDAVAIDAIHLEGLDLDARGGADTLALTDLAGTDVKQLNLALGGGDGQADSVFASGSDGADAIAVVGGLGVGITGLAPAVSITGTEPSDSLTIDGRAGADSIDAGGLPADRMRLTLRGGPDADTLTGSPGDDDFRSSPGDGADAVDGGGGIDTAALDGSDASDSFSAAASGSRVELTRGPDGGAIDATRVERVELSGLGGGDAATVDDLAGTDVTQTNVDLGDGADSAIVHGTAAADNVKLAGGGGGSVNVTGLASTVSIAHADTITVDTLAAADRIDASSLAAGSAALRFVGGQGADTLTGSAGDDTFVWNPGDESDVLEGRAGADTLEFNGTNADEQIGLFANGPQLRLIRDVAAVSQDAAGVERVDIAAGEGKDTITVGDLSGTDVTHANFDLSGPDPLAPDGDADRVVVNGTANADNVTVSSDAFAVHATTPQAAISITRSEAGLDNLTINGLAGTDNVDASGLAAGIIGMLINGGQGNDTLTGSQGADTFTWNPGDASDRIDAGDGTDTLQFNGANVGEKISLTPNGSRFLFTRDIANVSLDVGGTERVNFLARGSADTIDVGDLSGTGVTQTSFDLSNGFGAGDAAADTVTVQGTAQNDVVSIAGSAGDVTATGLPWAVDITGAEAANDRLTVRGANGDDVLQASDLAADGIALTLDGANDNDVILGGAGNDTLLGGFGDDFINGGPGQDDIDAGPGNNVVIQ